MINTFEPHLFCNRAFVNQAYKIPYTAMILENYIDVRVEFTTEEKLHYSFGGMFLLKKAYGIIFHYQSDVSSTDIMLWVVNGILHLSRKHAKDQALQYTSNTAVLEANNWMWISMGVGKYGFVFANIGNDTVIRGTAQADTDRTIELPGNLRIGGTFYINMLPFNGLVSCVGFFVETRFPDANSTLHLCNAWRGMLFIALDFMFIL